MLYVYMNIFRFELDMYMIYALSNVYIYYY